MEKDNRGKAPELLAPAGDWASLTAALENGADAIYFGVPQLNMRDNARSFELTELSKVMAHISEAGAKGYLTLNSIVFDSELELMRKIIDAAIAARVDAVICWDMSVVSYCRSVGMAVHLSTQASVSNFAAVRYYASLGVERIVLARECTLETIRAISDQIAVENLSVTLEAFVHGALCVSMSGRCFMSEYLYGESANRGRCLQPCRRKYEVHDLEGEADLVLEDGFVMSPKDLCALPFLKQVVAAGIMSCKVEGRMRPPEYVAAVVRAYREALDAIATESLTPERVDRLLADISLVYNRGFSAGFYFGRPLNDLINVGGSVATEKKVYIGEVWKYYKKIGVAEVRVRNEGLVHGQRVMFIGDKTGVCECVLTEMQMNHTPVDACQKGDVVALKVPAVVRKGDKLFSFRSEATD